MASELAIIDALTGIDGADAREEFARAWMEACRRADGEAPAAGARDA